MTQFLFLNLFFLVVFPFLSQANDKQPTYTCKVDNECLTHLKEKLLSKESRNSFYNLCKYAHKTYKNCCSNPESCEGSYGREVVQNLKSNSASLVKNSGDSFQSCQLHNLSNLSNLLSNTQGELCSKGVKNCEMDCDNELLNFKKTFKDCFNINHPHTIDSVLKESKNNNSACFKEIKEISRKFKDQTLNKKFLFKEDIMHKDIIRCDDIEKERSRDNLNSLVLNVCERAKGQQGQMTGEPENQREKEESKAREEEARFKTESLTRQTREEELRKAEDKIREEMRLKEEKKEKSNLFGVVGVGGALAGVTVLNSENQIDSQFQRSNYDSKDSTISKNLNSWMKNPEIEKEKGFLEKTKDKLSSLGEVTKNKFGQLLGDPPKHCPINILESAIVFQSVKAPQIEPMSKLPTPKDYYNNYDLIRNKPAIALLKIDTSLLKNFKNQDKVSIEVKKDNDPQTSKCSDFFSKSNIETKDLEIKQFSTGQCSFSIQDINSLGGVIYKIVSIPTEETVNTPDEVTKHNLDISFNIQTNTYKCSSKKNFSYSLMETKDLFLEFMTLKYKEDTDCKKFSTDSTKITEFYKSLEVEEYLPRMFPTTKNKVHLEKANESIEGTCYNIDEDTKQRAKNLEKSPGVLFDSLNVDLYLSKKFWSKVPINDPKKYEKYLKDNQYIITSRLDKFGQIIYNRKAIVLINESYMNFHAHNSPSWGFVILGRSYNITFVSADQKNKSTILHELSHLLGQGKEMYEGKNSCKTFWDEKTTPCNVYKTQGFEASFLDQNLIWKFLNNKWSFMNNKQRPENNWIDRETYQKVFQTMSYWKDYNLNESLTARFRNRQMRTSIAISGIYDKGTNKFSKAFSIPVKEAIPSLSDEKGNLLVELALEVKNPSGTKLEPLYESRVSTDVKMEIFYEKEIKKVNLEKVPISVVLPLHKEYFNNKMKNVRFIVRNSQTREEIYRGSIDWEKNVEDHLNINR